MATDEVKQVILVRTDIDMKPGKMAAQVGHAAVMSYLEANKATRDVAEKWLREGEKKIVLRVDSEADLKKFYEAFKYKKVPCALVTDAGLTELPPGTVTALGVGPAKSSDVDPLTKVLKLF